MVCALVLGVRSIAVQLGRSPSTISRGLRRNRKHGSNSYRPHDAGKRAAARRASTPTPPKTQPRSKPNSTIDHAKSGVEHPSPSTRHPHQRRPMDPICCYRSSESAWHIRGSIQLTLTDLHVPREGHIFNNDTAG